MARKSSSRRNRSGKARRPAKKVSAVRAATRGLGNATNFAMKAMTKVIPEVLGMFLPTSGAVAPIGMSPSGGLAITAPVNSGYVHSGTKPLVRSTRNGGARVTHKDWCFDVVAPTDSSGNLIPGFQVIASQALNPLNAIIFPWLAKLASLYESYKIHNCTFMYEQSAPTNIGGDVMMCVDYEGDDPSPTDARVLSAYDTNVTGIPWSNMVMPLRTGKNTGVALFTETKMVRSQPNQPAIISDFGRLFVAAQSGAGWTAGLRLGKVLVYVDIEFMNPDLTPGNSCAVLGPGTSIDVISNPAETANAQVLQTVGVEATFNAQAMNQLGDFPIFPHPSPTPNAPYAGGQSANGITWQKTGCFLVQVSWTALLTATAPVVQNRSAAIQVNTNAAPFIRIKDIGLSGFAQIPYTSTLGTAASAAPDSVLYTFLVQVLSIPQVSDPGSESQAWLEFFTPVSRSNASTVPNNYVLNVVVTEVDQQVCVAAFPQTPQVAFNSA